MKQARINKLMSQKVMARKLGINHCYYNQIENGKREPGIDLKKKINEVLETKIY